MKTQQRKFVVEFKSGRRRSSLQPDSIWGNTDLKAFVREVEADAPELFSAPPVSHGSDDHRERQADQEPQDCAVGEDMHAALANLHQRDLIAHGAAETVPALSVEQGTSLEQPSETKKRKRKFVVSRNERVERPTQSENSIDAFGDRLDLLDEENRELKRLLAAYLLDQNAKLQKMLERFEAP